MKRLFAFFYFLYFAIVLLAFAGFGLLSPDRALMAFFGGVLDGVKKMKEKILRDPL